VNASAVVEDLSKVTSTDPELFLHINAFARAIGWQHPLMTGWAGYGIIAFVALMLAGWWRARRRADAGVMAAALWAPLATLLAVAVNQPIVAMGAEPRPYATLPGILVLGHPGNDPSCPSDHAVVAGAAAAVLFLVDRRLGEVAAIAAALLAFSRVYIAAHYPADVLIGLGLGVTVACIGWLAARRVLTAAVIWLSGARWRALVTACPRLATAS
jgi:membrane-associated phospholipid phosphatase